MMNATACHDIQSARRGFQAGVGGCGNHADALDLVLAADDATLDALIAREPEFRAAGEVRAFYMEARRDDIEQAVGAAWYHSGKKLSGSAGTELEPSVNVAAAVEMLVRILISEVTLTVQREIAPLRQDIARLRGEGVGLGSTASTPDGTGLWTAREAAAFLGTSASWVYHRSAEGTIPCVRVRHNLRFDPDTLRAWIRGERGAGRVVALKKK